MAVDKQDKQPAYRSSMLPNLFKLVPEHPSRPDIGPIYSLDHFEAAPSEHDSLDPNVLYQQYTAPISRSLEALMVHFENAKSPSYLAIQQDARNAMWRSIRMNLQNRDAHYATVIQTTERSIEQLKRLIASSKASDSSSTASAGRARRRTAGNSPLPLMWHQGGIDDDGRAIDATPAEEPDPNSPDAVEMKRLMEIKSNLLMAKQRVQEELLSMGTHIDRDNSNANQYVRVRANRLVELLSFLKSRPGTWNAKSYIATRLETFKAGVVERPGDTQNLLLVGGAGVGKTSTAKIIAEILVAMGVLTKPPDEPIDASLLRGRYEGHTAGNVHSHVLRSLDGTLILDEIYALSNDKAGSYGEEAINALVAVLDQYSGLMSVMCLGYEEKVVEFLSRNQGMQRRFRTTIKFDPYTPEELLQIYDMKLRERHLPDMDQQAALLIRSVIDQSKSEQWQHNEQVKSLFDVEADSMRALSVVTEAYVAKKLAETQIPLSSIGLIDMVHIILDHAANNVKTAETARLAYVMIDIHQPFHNFLYSILNEVRQNDSTSSGAASSPAQEVSPSGRRRERKKPRPGSSSSS